MGDADDVTWMYIMLDITADRKAITSEGERQMTNCIKRLLSDEEGLTTVEYALLLALLVVAAITVWTTFGATIRNKVAASGNAINGLS